MSAAQTIRFRFCLYALIAACLLAAGSRNASGQVETAKKLAAMVRAQLPALDLKPTAADWLRSHPAEKLQLARYNVQGVGENFDYTAQGCWCARAGARVDLPQGAQLDRYAMFYPPAGKPGPLPPLPAEEDASLVQRGCTLLALRYEVQTPGDLTDLASAVSDELSKSWGPSHTVSRPKHPPWPWLYDPNFAWQHGEETIWIVADTKGRFRGPRLLILAWNRPALVSGDFSPSYDNDAWFPPHGQPSIAGAAAGLAGLDPAVSREILRQLALQWPIPAHDRPHTLEPIEQWLRETEGLPPERKAAALIVADFYAVKAQDFDLYYPKHFRTRLAKLGARYGPADGDETIYKHNWLEQALKLTTQGPINELARVARLEDACAFEGQPPSQVDWRDARIPYGEELLRDFPSSEWTPWVHYVLARTHAAKLMLSYPDSDEGQSIPTSGPEAARLRQAAIHHFRAFLDAKLDAPEAVAFAWQEAWRLLAGLPPTPINFLCYFE